VLSSKIEGFQANLNKCGIIRNQVIGRSTDKVRFRVKFAEAYRKSMQGMGLYFFLKARKEYFQEACPEAVWQPKIHIVETLQHRYSLLEYNG